MLSTLYLINSTWPKEEKMSDDSEVPDVYCDQITLAQTAYGLAITFSLSPSTPSAIPGQTQAKPKVVVRMSLEHAKVMTMAIRKTLKQYELEHLGDSIKVPTAIYGQLNLSETDW